MTTGQIESYYRQLGKQIEENRLHGLTFDELCKEALMTVKFAIEYKITRGDLLRMLAH